MKQENVILHQQIIPEYRVPVFNLILEQNPNCVILYGQPNINSSLKNGAIPSSKGLKEKKNFYPFNKNAFVSNIYKEILKSRPKVIITQYSPGNLNVFLLLFLRFFLKFKLVGWYHGWNRAKPFSTNKTLYDRLRHWMLKKADGVILYSDDAKEILSKYKKAELIFVANNTLDTRKLESLRGSFEKISIEQLKVELGFKTKYNLIYCSRLEAKKKPMEMLRLFRQLYDKLENITLHIVGDGPMGNDMKEYVKLHDIKNVIFYGSIYDDEVVGKMIYTSDMMILPQWVGLSVVHAFCFGCPVTTFHATYHPPEIAYMEHGKNGFIFNQVSDSETIGILSSFLQDPDIKDTFRLNTLRTIREKASIDKMTQGVTDAIKYFSN